jgi:hypothetical protein
MKSKIILVVFSILATSIGCRVSTNHGLFLTDFSPDKTYAIELVGNPDIPNDSCSQHETNLNLFKNGEFLVKNANLETYDNFDSGFTAMYPEREWLSNSVLRFGKDVKSEERRFDLLSISNKTDKNVKYLRIKADDLLLLFEVPANSKIKISVPHQSWSSWIWSNGEFEDGSPLKSNGANFSHQDKINSILKYCVSIEDTSIKVESPIMDGYINGTSKDTDIPTNINCE